MSDVSLKIKGILTGHGGKSNHFAKALSKAIVSIAPHLKLEDNKKYRFSCIIEKEPSFPDVFHSFSNIELVKMKEEGKENDESHQCVWAKKQMFKCDGNEWFAIDHPENGKLFCASCGKDKDKENE